MPIKEDENSLTGAGGKGRNPRLPVAVGASKSTASQNNLTQVRQFEKRFCLFSMG